MRKAYKLFKIKDGRLYPLYVFAKEEVILNTYLYAKEPKPTERGKVKSKLGELAYRPGWHLTEIPLADHIGKKQPNGKLYQAKDTVWCEVEYEDSTDYTELAKSQSTNRRDQCFKHLINNGFYIYKTNPNAKVNWIIASGIIVRRILTNEEVAKICRENGFEPQPVED